MDDEMIQFKGTELLDGAVYRAAAWTEEAIRDLFSETEKAQWFNRNKKVVEWSGEDFDRHQGTRVQTPVETAVYRRIYHGKDRIEGKADPALNHSNPDYAPQPDAYVITPVTPLVSLLTHSVNGQRGVTKRLQPALALEVPVWRDACANHQADRPGVAQ